MIFKLDPEPDIAIIQEVAKPKKLVDNCVWTPSTIQSRGVAVIARNGFTVTPFPLNTEVHPVFLPVVISGLVNFHVLGVWTLESGKYIASFKKAFEKYKDFLKSKPAIIAGDFNSNVSSDKKYPEMNFSGVRKYCESELGLVSSYHTKKMVAFGQENEPTHFHNGIKKSYHIDYCFLPKNWHIDDVTIGKFEDWQGKSDHCPVIVDVSIDSGNFRG